jgi:hypothetical protein
VRAGGSDPVERAPPLAGTRSTGESLLLPWLWAGAVSWALLGLPPLRLHQIQNHQGFSSVHLRREFGRPNSIEATELWDRHAKCPKAHQPNRREIVLTPHSLQLRLREPLLDRLIQQLLHLERRLLCQYGLLFAKFALLFAKFALLLSQRALLLTQLRLLLSSL